jgi:hypothetical protein
VTTSVEKVNGTPVASEPRVDPVRAAEAEAIRSRATAERQALLTKAEGEKALKLEQAEQLRLENEKQALANERAALRFQREKSEQLTKIAKADKEREDIERARAAERRQDDEQQQTAAAKAKAIEKASKRWRNVALSFYALCAGVALPVQMNAFYDPQAEYLLVAPVFIEVIALVALVGAAAAVTAGRPHWHYRLVAWAGALTAATINIVHGLAEYDPATAFGTALASIAGPGMWDLHEHGRILKRDGKPSWRERRAQKKAAKAEIKQKAAEEAQRAAEQAAAEEAAEEAAKQLAEARAEYYPEVWAHAVRLAAAEGETSPSEKTWRRAYLDVEGADPGESAEVIRARNVAAKRVESARSNAPVNTVSKTTNAQRASQVPAAKKTRVYNPPARRGQRTKGDVKYTPGANRQASIAARKAAAQKDPS